MKDSSSRTAKNGIVMEKGLQDYFRKKTQTRLLKNWSFITEDLSYLHWKTLPGYRANISLGSGCDQRFYSLSTKASMSQSHTKKPFK